MCLVVVRSGGRVGGAGAIRWHRRAGWRRRGSASKGSNAAPQQAEIARLENVVDRRNSQIKETRAVAAHNAKGFDAMSTLVGYLANDVSIEGR